MGGTAELEGDGHGGGGVTKGNESSHVDEVDGWW